mgnify:CR=1 FL=1
MLNVDVPQLARRWLFTTGRLFALAACGCHFSGEVSMRYPGYGHSLYLPSNADEWKAMEGKLEVRCGAVCQMLGGTRVTPLRARMVCRRTSSWT